MSKNKILLKERVITSGQGARRAVLDWESNLAYQYDNPANVLAVFERGKGWILKESPSYYRGGWGNSSRGDADGYYLMENVRSMFSAIGARVYRVNAPEFLTPAELKARQKAVDAQNRLIEKQNKIQDRLKAKNLEYKILQPLEVEGMKIEVIQHGVSKKGMDPLKTVIEYEKSVETFINGKGKTLDIGGYHIEPNVIRQGGTTVAFRDSKGDVFLNSQELSTTGFENEFMGGQSLIQKAVRKAAKYSIPFNVLDAAGLDLSETQVIEQGPESDHQIVGRDGITRQRHFTGALLLLNNGRRFLMDIDRREINFGIFNAFFVEVSGVVNTIEQAYYSMKPTEVIAAESQGLKVERQGEWFFIPTDKTVTVDAGKVMEWLPSETEVKNGIKCVAKVSISHGKGRPNDLYKPIGFGELDQYVCGNVTHSGREHKDLDLGSSQGEPRPMTEFELQNKVQPDATTVRTKIFKLWKVIGNTTVGNFTIKGNVD
jgi:hypothetical protein